MRVSSIEVTRTQSLQWKCPLQRRIVKSGVVVINLFPKSARLCERNAFGQQASKARLAQSAERKALNLVVVGSSPTVGVFH